MRAWCPAAARRLVASQEGRIQCFGERDVDGIIGCQVVPELPDPRQNEVVRIAAKRQVCQIGQSGGTTIVVDFTRHGVPPKHLRDLHIEQMWSMERSTCIEHSRLH